MASQWEYTAFVGEHRINNGVSAGVSKKDMAKLNEYGSKGWEVVAINSVEQVQVSAVITSIKIAQNVFYLKRSFRK